ncbi:MAG: Bug family tripartite tricarboxylate transporter substrate binding protein [Burkholderiales bacterium]
MKSKHPMSALAGLFFVATGCLAQSWPDKPIRLVSAYPPGGAADLVARTISPRMKEALGQQAIVEHRAGAGGQIGAQNVATSPPDGHTFLITVGPAHLLAKFISKSLPYDPVKDFTPVTAATTIILALAANAAFPPNNVAELIEYGKRNPGKISYGTTAIGGEAHLSMEYIASLAGISATHVPYKGGGPAATDLVGNHIPMLILPITTVMEHVQKGAVKIIGIMYNRRFQGLPQVATVTETLPAFTSFGSWIAVYGPPKLPPAIANRFHAYIAETMNLPEIRDRLAGAGTIVTANTPAQFADQIERSMDVYAKLARAANIKPE